MELKRINFEENSFTANGVEYSIDTELSIDRFIEFEKVQSHVGFGVDFNGVANKLKDAYSMLNKSKPADAAIIIHNLLNGIVDKLEDRTHPIFKLCALFINAKDENKDKYDEDVMNKKIADWRKEGFYVNDFFQLAFNLVDNFIPIYNEISQSISEKMESLTEVLNTTERK